MCVGQPFPTARRQEWTNGLVWSHLSWLVGRGFAWWGSALEPTVASGLLPLWRHCWKCCPCDVIIKPEMSLKPLLLRRTDPPLSCTTLHLAFIMKALVWQQSWFPPERVTHKNTKYDYDTPFCRRIYYLADQFNSKKKNKNLYIFEGSSWCCYFLHSIHEDKNLHSGAAWCSPLLVPKNPWHCWAQSEPVSPRRLFLTSSSVEKKTASTTLGFWMYCEHYKIHRIIQRNVSLGPTWQTKISARLLSFTLASVKLCCNSILRYRYVQDLD